MKFKRIDGGWVCWVMILTYTQDLGCHVCLKAIILSKHSD